MENAQIDRDAILHPLRWMKAVDAECATLTITI